MNLPRILMLCVFLLPVSPALPAQSGAASGCGKVISLATHDGTTTRYALVSPKPAAKKGKAVALVLLAGGGGHLDLDDQGCPQELKGNSLVRSLPLFHKEGFITALVDSPSDYAGGEGLGGFRIAAEHAEDLGKVITDVRKRTGASVWLVGTSRGTISAANAASRLSGAAAPDGVVLTSALMSGSSAAKKKWVANSVFDLPLESVRIPLLVVGHAEDKCIRTPPDMMEKITKRTNSAREQVVTVTGGPGWSGGSSVEACKGKSPHGYLGQEAEVAAGIARFVRGGKY